MPRLLLLLIAILVVLVVLAGCGAGDKLADDDVVILNEANRAVSQSFEAAGQAVVQCSRQAMTEQESAACVDQNFAGVEPAVQAALVDYDAVLLRVEDVECKSAIQSYRTDLDRGGELVSRARRAAVGLDWDELAAIGNQLQTTFVADLKADQQKLVAACDLEAS